MKSLLVTLLALTLPASSAAGQEAIARRFMAGFYVYGGAVKAPLARSTASSTQSGGGVGARIGWGITPRITLFTSLSALRLAYDKSDSSTNSSVTHGALGASYHFASARRSIMPYVEVARSAIELEARTIDATGVKSFGLRDGAGWTVGAGIDRLYSKSWALNVGLDVTLGELESGGATTITRFSVGTTYRPYGRR